MVQCSMLHFCLSKSVWNPKFFSGILFLRSDDSVGDMLLTGGFHIVTIVSHLPITPAPGYLLPSSALPSAIYVLEDSHIHT